MDRGAFLRTMRILSARHPQENWATGMTPFEILVSTVLSQSTTVSNERRGMEGLVRAFGMVRPEVLAQAPTLEIERAIWHAGLSHRKAGRIRAIAKAIVRDSGGNLDGVLSQPPDVARRTLMGLPGVGPKTADVVLAMAGGHPRFPVDTHVARIARRWDLAPTGGYEATRKALEAWTSPGSRRAWHLAMIAHGRELCRARKPLCDACPVARDCDWHRSTKHRKRDKGLRRPKS